MADINVNDLTFGCEIECFIPTQAMNDAGWRVGMHTNGNRLPGFDGWKAASDCSIRADYGYTPVELVSPVLRGAEGLASVQRMAERIRQMGGKVNASCGFHVHVGFGDRSAKELVRLMFVTANVETGLFASTGLPARQQNTFCKSIKAGFQALKDGAANTPTGLAQKCRAVNDRYHVLNVSNWLSVSRTKPTVEFRVFSGTVNTTKMKAYIQLCLGLVQYALEQERKVKWDAAMRPYVFTGGAGESEVKRMLAVLGWSQTYGFKVRGVLDESSLPACKKLLVQLGRKFDGGPRRADDVVVD